ncbi:MAG: hypothetical protein ABIB79_00885 [archaeon]
MKKEHLVVISIIGVLILVFLFSKFLFTSNVIYDAVYGVAESCGDGDCDSGVGESCSTCSADCGECTSSSSSSSGSSGGGSSTSVSSSGSGVEITEITESPTPDQQEAESEIPSEEPENKATEQGFFRSAGGAVTDIFKDEQDGKIVWMRIIGLIVILGVLWYSLNKFLQNINHKH